jgi:hypothetical protein
MNHKIKILTCHVDLVKLRIPLFLFIATLIIYYITSGGTTPYNYFVYLADAFLHGRLYLTEHPSWLGELVPVNGKYYVIYPPMPALVILPFVAFRGMAFDQTLGSILIGSLNSVLVYMLVKKFFFEDNKRANMMALWMAILFSFGTIYWYLASVGSSWYFAHVTAVFFLFWALNEVFGKRRPLLIGILLGAAYWSRLPIIFSILFFLLMLRDEWSNGAGEYVKSSKKNYILSIFKFSLGIGIFVCLNFLYNYLRFGSISDMAYYLQPGMMNEPWTREGLFNLIYIPSHLEILLFKGPLFLSTFPYIQPSWAGMAIWMTTPAFIFALKSPRDEITLACWSAIIPVALLVMSHGGTGFTQFGYRYAMDFYPFLLILTVRGMALNWYHKLFIGISILVNLWGVLWINKFGWVGW